MGVIMKDKEQVTIKRMSPPVFPMGFRLSKADGVCIIDLLDNTNDTDKQCFYSIVLTTKQAGNLGAKLLAFSEGLNE